MGDIIKFNYEGKAISFEFKDGNKLINATEMSKPFEGKRINNFLRTQQTQDYIKLLESRYAKKRIGANELQREVLRVVKGGLPELQGTWMDEKLALKFAAWLSPDFELWVYDRIMELVTTGETSLNEVKESAPSTFARTLRIIADQLERQEEINEDVENRIKELEAKITSSDENYYTIAGYCALHHIPCPLEQAKKWGRAATYMSRQRHIETGTAHDERYGKVRTYHRDILKEVIEE